MNINNAKEFVLLLNGVSQSKTYLHRNNNGKLRFINEYDKKNLKTADIANLAEECFTVLRKEDQSQLANSLQNYLGRVNSSKSRMIRIAAFFGFKSEAERKIQHIIEQINNLDSEKKGSFFQSLKKYNFGCLIDSSRFINPLGFNADVSYKAKLFYHKVLARKPVPELKQKTTGIRGNLTNKFTKLEGLTFEKSLESVIKDLTNYYANFDYSKPEILQLVEELNFALSTLTSPSLLINSKTFLGVGFSSSQIKEQAKKITEDIKKLPEKLLDQRQAVIITGGFKGHAVLYSIERELNGAFSFTIINTGAGGRTSSIEVEENGMCHIPKGNMTNVKFIGLTDEHLTVDFIHALLEMKNKQKSMNPVLDFINARLAFDGNSNIRVNQYYKGQESGVCAMKCIFSLLRERLGEDEYRKFKSFMTTLTIEQFISHKQELISFLSEDVYQSMIEQGRQVSEKRAHKALNSTESE